MTTSIPFPLRLAREGEDGVEFITWLSEHCGGAKPKTDRLTAFIQAWDHLRDEVRDEDPSRTDPTVEEYAARWNESVPTVYRMQAEFRELFPTERTPGRLCDLLWDGMPKWGSGTRPDPPIKWLLAVEVVEN